MNGKQLENPKYTQTGGSGFAFGPLLGGNEGTKDYETAKWFEQQLQRDYDNPFFMAVGLSKPHLPFYAPQEYFDLYDLETVVVPGYRMDDLDDILDSNGEDLLVFTFGSGMEVSVALTSEGDYTVLELTQYQIPTDEASKFNFHLGCSRAWSTWMLNLKGWLEHGILLHDTDLGKREDLFDFVNT